MSENESIAAEAAEQAQGAPEGDGRVSEPQRKRKKKPVIIGAVVAVIVVAAAGFWVWHEQPEFCNAFCHLSMTEYVDTYTQEAGTAGTDKWHNEVGNTDAMLAVSHREAGNNCLSCHVPSIGQQLGEVAETITGNYEWPLEEVTVNELVENAGGAANDGDSFCLRSGCHDVTTREELTAATAGLARNPHSWQHTNNPCSDCHKSHRASVMYCTQCHDDAAAIMPDGWVTYEEGQQIYASQLDFAYDYAREIGVLD